MIEIDSKLLKNLDVLYVEDDAVVASQTVSLLESFLNAVYYYDNAEEALEFLKSNTVHMIVTDIELPGMSGLELCKEIRKSDRKLPIFITTVHRDTEKLIEAISLNLVDYLIKPVSVSSMKDILLKTLRRLEENGSLIVKINNDTEYFPLYGEVEVLGECISLTKKETALLDLLLLYKGQIVSHETIEHEIYYDDPISEAAYKSFIYRLRKKIGKKAIVSVSGVGLKLHLEN